MVQSKIEIFTAMLAEQPEDAMIWYDLASEQYKLENWAEAALARAFGPSPEMWLEHQGHSRANTLATSKFQDRDANGKQL